MMWPNELPRRKGLPGFTVSGSSAHDWSAPSHDFGVVVRQPLVINHKTEQKQLFSWPGSKGNRPEAYCPVKSPSTQMTWRRPVGGSPVLLFLLNIPFWKSTHSQFIFVYDVYASMFLCVYVCTGTCWGLRRTSGAFLLRSPICSPRASSIASLVS